MRNISSLIEEKKENKTQKEEIISEAKKSAKVNGTEKKATESYSVKKGPKIKKQ